MRVAARIDRLLCRGTGLCVAMDSELFALDEDGIAVVRAAEDRDGRPESLCDIAACCPTGAITVITAEHAEKG